MAWYKHDAKPGEDSAHNENLPRALILLPHDIPGGAERVTMTVAEAALNSDRFSHVVIFVLSRGDNGTLAHLAVHPKANIVFSKSKRQRGGLLDLLRICNQGPYDFVFSSFIDLNAAASLLRKLRILKTRWLVARESTMIFERDFGWKNPLARGLYRLYGAQDLIVCQSERMVQSLNAHTGNKLAQLVRSVPNPIPFSVVKRVESMPAVVRSNGEERIAWCGRISEVKSPLRAIETLACLHKLGRGSARLVMIGEGPLRAQTEALAQSMGLAAHVEFTGYVSRPIEIMKTCCAGLMTSDIEGFPNVILEMMSTGMAGVASTDCAGGLAEIPGVEVADCRTPQALAEGLYRIMQRNTPPQDLPAYMGTRHPRLFLERILIEAE